MLLKPPLENPLEASSCIWRKVKDSVQLETFKTPEPVKKITQNNADNELIENTPENETEIATKKRRLFKLKKQTSKVGRLFSSTTSVVSGNLEKKATEVQSPPKCKEEFAKKRHLSPEPLLESNDVKIQKLSTSPGFQPSTNSQKISTPTQDSSTPTRNSQCHISTPVTSNSISPKWKKSPLRNESFQIKNVSTPESRFTRLKKSPLKNDEPLTPTQIIDDDESSRSPKKVQPSFTSPMIISKNCLSASYGRHLIEKVEQTPSAVILNLRELAGSDGMEKLCYLKGSWMNTDVQVDDIVNILSVDEKDDGKIVIDDMNGLIVINPDLLVSGTSIVSTLFCMRKAVLSERFKGHEGTSRSMLTGTLVHELLQESLKQNHRSFDQISRQLENCLESNKILKDLLLLKMSKEEIQKEVEPFLPHILFFIEKYVVGNVKIEPPIAAYGTSSQQKTYGGKTQIWPGRVEAIMDIEENIWSPRLGIKGKVDLTIQVKLQQKDKKGRTCKTMPLELKTGRPSGSAEHRGQVILYSMMMSERRPDPESGLLLYLRTSSVQEVKAGIHEMRGLVQLRNQLVYHLRQKEQLPGPINAKRACKDCAHLNACAIYQKLEDQVPEEPHGMAELVPQALSHLSSDDMKFFNKWSLMNGLESGEARKGSKLKSLWCMTPFQRECKGQAISELKVIKSEFPMTTFAKDKSDLGACMNIFQPGDLVIVSSNQELALAQGPVLSITSTSITLTLDKELCAGNKIYSIDKYEYASSGSGNWINLARLMSNHSKAKMIREAIINKNPAEFVSGLSKETALIAKPILRPMKLNSVQSKAIFKVRIILQYALLS